MTRIDDLLKKAAELRWYAEKKLERDSSDHPQPAAPWSQAEMLRTLHELAVHQVELEMQNEQIRSRDEELEAARARYYDLYNSAPVGYCTLSEGLIEEANQTAANLLGTTPGKLAGQPLVRFIHKEDQDIYYLFRNQPFPGHDPRECELRMMRQDSTAFWVHLSAMEGHPPLSQGAAEPGGKALTRLVMADITARKQDEEEKARLQARLQQAREFEVLGNMAGGLAHELNNLLTSILGNASLTSLEVEPNGKVTSYMTAIQTASMRAAELTRQMLAYAGRGKFLELDTDLNLVVKETLQRFADTLPANVTITCDLSDRLPYCKGDTSQISQVVVNLLRNATEAFPPGQEGRITVRTRSEVLDQSAIDGETWDLPISPGRFSTLEVIDGGIGMEPEVLTHLFEPFYSTKFTGRGLGLAAVFGILRSHGGGLLARSEPGRGSSLKILFPVMRAGHSKRAPESLPIWRHEGRILVVDDEEALRSRVRQLAEQLGFTVIEAPGGVEAVELFRQWHGELATVLLDLDMPRMDGREAFRAIQGIDSAIPVVFSHPFDSRGAEPGIEGHAGILRKPFRAAEFQLLLQRVVA
jgi:PAS domain S-box-containing protein